MYVAARNVSDSDIVIDRVGSVIPAGRWGVCVPTNAELSGAVADGCLHLYPFGAEGSEEIDSAVALARHLNDSGATVLDDAHEA